MTEYALDFVARALSTRQQEFLADHFEGKRRIVQGPFETRTRASLMLKELIKPWPPNAMTPSHTMLTKRGHGVMCAALGHMADILTASGHGTEKDFRRFAYGEYVERSRHPHDDGNATAGKS